MMYRSLVVGVMLLLTVTACSTVAQPDAEATPYVPDMPRAAPHPTPWTDRGLRDMHGRRSRRGDI